MAEIRRGISEKQRALLEVSKRKQQKDLLEKNAKTLAELMAFGAEIQLGGPVRYAVEKGRAIYEYRMGDSEKKVRQKIADEIIRSAHALIRSEVLIDKKKVINDAADKFEWELELSKGYPNVTIYPLEKYRARILIGAYEINNKIGLEVNQKELVAQIKNRFTVLEARPREPFTLSEVAQVYGDVKGRVFTATAEVGIVVDLKKGIHATAKAKLDITFLEGEIKAKKLVGSIPIGIKVKGKLISASIGLTVGTDKLELCFAPGVGGCLEIFIGTEEEITGAALFEIE